MDWNASYNPNLSRNPMRKGLLRRPIPLNDSNCLNRLPTFPKNMPGTYNRSPSQLCRTLMQNINSRQKRDGSTGRDQPGSGECSREASRDDEQPRSFLGECPIETRENYKRRGQPKINREPVRKCLFGGKSPLNDSNVPSCSRFPTLPTNVPGALNRQASQICRTLMQKRNSPKQRRASSSSRAQTSSNAQECLREPKASYSSHDQPFSNSGVCPREPRDSSSSRAQPPSTSGVCPRQPRDSSRSRAQPSSNSGVCPREPRDSSSSRAQPSSNSGVCPRVPKDSSSSSDQPCSNAAEEARIPTPSCRIFPPSTSRPARQAFPLSRTFQTRSRPREESRSRRPDPGSNSGEQSRETEGTCSRLPEPGSGEQSRATEGTCSRLPDPGSNSGEEARIPTPCRIFPTSISRPARQAFPLSRTFQTRSRPREESCSRQPDPNSNSGEQSRETEGTCSRLTEPGSGEISRETEGTCSTLPDPGSISGEGGRNASICSRFATDSSRPTRRDFPPNRTVPLRSRSTGIAEPRLSLPAAPRGPGRSLSNSSIPLTNQEQDRRGRLAQYRDEGHSLHVSEIQDRDAEVEYGTCDRRLLPPEDLQNANRPWPFGVRGRQLNIADFKGRDNRRRVQQRDGGRSLHVSELQELDRPRRLYGMNRSFNLSEFQDDSAMEQSELRTGGSSANRAQYRDEGHSLHVSEIQDRDAEVEYGTCDRRLLPPEDLQNANRPWPFGVRGRQLNIADFKGRDNRRRVQQRDGGRSLHVSELQELDRPRRLYGMNRSFNLSEFQDGSAMEQSELRDSGSSSSEQTERRDVDETWYSIPAREGQDRPSPATFGTRGGVRRPFGVIQDGSAPGQPSEESNDVCQIQNAQREPFQIYEDSPPRPTGQPSEEPTDVCQILNAQREQPFQIYEDSPPIPPGQPSEVPCNICQIQNAQREARSGTRGGVRRPLAEIQDGSAPARSGTRGGVRIPLIEIQDCSALGDQSERVLLPWGPYGKGAIRRLNFSDLSSIDSSMPGQPFEEPNNVCQIQNAQREQPFQIYEDSPPRPPPFQIYEDSPPRPPQFQIYEDSPARPPQFQIYEDSPPRPPGQKSEEPCKVCQIQNAQRESARPCPPRVGSALPASTVLGRSLPARYGTTGGVGRSLLASLQNRSLPVTCGTRGGVRRPLVDIQDCSTPGQPSEESNDVCQIQNAQREPFQIYEDSPPRPPGQPSEESNDVCQIQNAQREQQFQIYEDSPPRPPQFQIYEDSPPRPPGQKSEEPCNVCQIQNAQRESARPCPPRVGSALPASTVHSRSLPARYGTTGGVGRLLPASLQNRSLPVTVGKRGGGGRRPLVEVQDGSAPAPLHMIKYSSVVPDMTEWTSQGQDIPDWTMECTHFEEASNPCQYQDPQRESYPSFEVCGQSTPRPPDQLSEEQRNVFQIRYPQRQGQPSTNNFLQVPNFHGELSSQISPFRQIPAGEPSTNIFLQVPTFQRELSSQISPFIQVPAGQPSTSNFLQVPSFQRELSFQISPFRPVPCTPSEEPEVCGTQIAQRVLSFCPIYGSTPHTSEAAVGSLPEPSSALYRSYTVSNVSQGQSSQGEECDRSGRPVPLSDFAYNALQTLSSGTIDQDPMQFPQRSISQTAARPQTAEKPRPTPIQRHPFFDKLVKDTYYPGLIVDAVNGLADFNDISFSATFRCHPTPETIEPESVPMSLLEAFDLRIQYEKDLRDDLERRRYFCSEEFLKEKERAKQDNEQHIDDNFPQWTHRDDHKLASTVDIDMTSRVASYPETPLTEAINCLLKAEKMNLYDRNVFYAEEAISGAVDGEKELAALKSTCSFKMELRKDAPTSSKSFERLAIVSYIGTTKPNND